MPSGAQTSKPCRPRLAAYIAMSARASSSERSRPWSGHSAMPMLASTCSGMPSSSKASRRAAPRPAADLAGAGGVRRRAAGRRTRRRPSAPAGRPGSSTCCRRGPTRQSRSSPTLCPKLSLISLNRSRSIIRTAQSRSSAAVHGGLELLDEPTAVGQPGERVVVGLGGQLGEPQLLDRAQGRVLDDQRALERHLRARPRGRPGTRSAAPDTEPVTTGRAAGRRTAAARSRRRPGRGRRPGGGRAARRSAASSTNTGSFCSVDTRHRATSSAARPTSRGLDDLRCASGQSTWRTSAIRPSSSTR